MIIQTGLGEDVTAPTPTSRNEKTLLGGLVGALAGAALGGAIGKVKGTILGAAVGGVGAGAVTYAVNPATTAAPPAPPPPSPPSVIPPLPPSVPIIPPGFPIPWHRLQSTDTVKSGQQLAIAIAGPALELGANQIGTAILQALQNSDATRLLNQYPPGSTLPTDWPADDDLGSEAYRMLIQAISDSPIASAWAFPPATVATVEAWTR